MGFSGPLTRRSIFQPFSCPVNRIVNVCLVICYSVYTALLIENCIYIFHVLAASNRKRIFRSVLKKTVTGMLHMYMTKTYVNYWSFKETIVFLESMCYSIII